MANKGAYIHLKGSDLKPEFHQFNAVVSGLASVPDCNPSLISYQIGPNDSQAFTVLLVRVEDIYPIMQWM